MQEVPDLIACEECDTLHRRVALGSSEISLCRRCGAELERDMSAHSKRVLPLTIASLFMYIIANVFPIAEMELHGRVSQTTLMGAVLSLNAQGMPLVAFLVFATTILFPLIQLLSLIYLLVSTNRFEHLYISNWLTRMIQTLRPWVMVEVLLLGVLVAYAKLMSMATVLPGPALWALGGLSLLLAAVFSFNPRYLWRISSFKNRKKNAILENRNAPSAEDTIEAKAP